MRILITGANGLLGTRLAETFLSRGHEVFSGYILDPPMVGKPVPMDITDDVSVRGAFKESCPGAVFHCAAMTDVDKCEEDPEAAIKVNSEGTSTVSRQAVLYNSYLAYISTDYVFDGSKGNYKESDQTNPVSVYGRSKLLGEEAVKSSGADFLIARSSVIYGAQPAMGKVNFALWLVESLRASRPVTLLTDQYVSPTLNTSLCGMLLEALEKRLTGTYHMAGATRVSRYEFGVALARIFSLDQSLIEVSTTRDFQGRWKATRPPDSSLDISKATSILQTKPLALNDALEELKKEIDG
jgi:dTDP-4-dehydrorhamnose reductase